jgi:hypothetical protein
MHLDRAINHLASNVAKISTRKPQYHAFFWSTKLHRGVQPLPVKGNASAPKPSKMRLYARLLLRDIPEKSPMTFQVLIINRPETTH